MSLLSANNLSYGVDRVSILKKLTIDVKQGELVGLIGPNGAGKSTLLQMLTCIKQPLEGEILLDGIDIRRLPAEQRARRFGYLAQGARAHWPFAVEKIVGLGRIPYQKWWQQESQLDREKIHQAMETTETLAYRNRIVSTLSGGEQTLVMLARIIASEPELIFADEPVAALDPYHQLHVMEILRNHATAKAAAVVVLHDLSLAARFCDRLYLLNHGELYCSGSPEVVLTAENIAEVYGVESRIVNNQQGVSITSLSRIRDHHP